MAGVGVRSLKANGRYGMARKARQPHGQQRAACRAANGGQCPTLTRKQWVAFIGWMALVVGASAWHERRDTWPGHGYGRSRGVRVAS